MLLGHFLVNVFDVCKCEAFVVVLFLWQTPQNTNGISKINKQINLKKKIFKKENVKSHQNQTFNH